MATVLIALGAFDVIIKYISSTATTAMNFSRVRNSGNASQTNVMLNRSEMAPQVNNVCSKVSCYERRVCKITRYTHWAISGNN